MPSTFLQCYVRLVLVRQSPITRTMQLALPESDHLLSGWAFLPSDLLTDVYKLIPERRPKVTPIFRLVCSNWHRIGNHVWGCAMYATSPCTTFAYVGHFQVKIMKLYQLRIRDLLGFSARFPFVHSLLLSHSSVSCQQLQAISRLPQLQRLERNDAGPQDAKQPVVVPRRDKSGHPAASGPFTSLTSLLLRRSSRRVI